MLPLEINGLPLWVIWVIFTSIVLVTVTIVVICCCCEQRIRQRRAVQYVEQTQVDELDWIRSQTSPRHPEEDQEEDQEEHQEEHQEEELSL